MKIFGPHTQRVLAFLDGLTDLSRTDLRTVAEAWRDTADRERAEAWVRIHRILGEGERLPVQAAASVARQEALAVAGRYGWPDWPFWAAASDAAAGIAAGDRIGRHRLVLVAPLTGVMPGLLLADGVIRTRGAGTKAGELPGRPPAGRLVPRRTDPAMKSHIRQLVDSFPDAILVVDAKGRIRHANNRARVLFGYDSDHLFGEPVHRLFPDRSSSHGAGHRSSARQKQSVRRWTTVGSRCDSGQFPAELTLIPMVTRRGTLSLVAVRDMTEAQRTRSALERTLTVLISSHHDRQLLLDHLVRAQEDERRRIAAGIHDDTVQVISAAHLRVQQLRNRLHEPGEIAIVDKLDEILQLSLDRLRQLIFDLRPSGLEEETPAAALRSDLEDMRSMTGIAFEFDEQVSDEGSAAHGTARLPDGAGGPGERAQARPGDDGPGRAGRPRRRLSGTHHRRRRRLRPRSRREPSRAPGPRAHAGARAHRRGLVPDRERPRSRDHGGVLGALGPTVSRGDGDVSNPQEDAAPIRVLIVEDHPVVAEGLAALLEDSPDLTIAGCVGSVASTATVIDELAADVAVIDFRLPDGTGADAADRIKARSPSTSIVFLSADGSDEVLLAAIEAGASSSLLKSATGKEIVDAIRSAAEGAMLIPAETITGLLARKRDSAREHTQRSALLGSLTPREQEILALMIHGADNRTIADGLTISYMTVRTHVRSILVKLGARSRLEAVAKATRSGFRG